MRLRTASQKHSLSMEEKYRRFESWELAAMQAPPAAQNVNCSMVAGFVSCRLARTALSSSFFLDITAIKEREENFRAAKRRPAAEPAGAFPEPHAAHLGEARHPSGRLLDDAGGRIELRPDLSARLGIAGGARSQVVGVHRRSGMAHSARQTRRKTAKSSPT